MSKNMNKRFFSEFLALLSLKVNPDPDAEDDAEIDIVKQIFSHNHDNPTAPELATKFPDDSSVDFYDEEESTGGIVLLLYCTVYCTVSVYTLMISCVFTGSCSSSCKETNPSHRDTRIR